MSESDDTSRPLADGRTTRSTVDRAREWILLDGDRFVVAAGVLLAVFGVLVAARRLGWIPLARSQPVLYVFSALISGNLTLITVVVSINQLLLSREFKSPGELESEIEDVIDYRQEVADEADRVTPVRPLGFLHLVFESTRQRAQRIGGMTFGSVGETDCTRIDEGVEALTEHVDGVLATLDSSDAGTFEVLSATLTTNYAREINWIRQVQADCGEDLPDRVVEALDALVRDLQDIDIARKYFRSLYLQEELSTLSRLLLYTGIPAEVISVLTLLGFTAARGSAPVHRVELLLPAAVTVGFLPLALLFAFIVRAAAVTERTAATVPFTTPDQER